MLDTPYVQIIFLQQLECLLITWLKQPNDAAFIDAHQAMLQFTDKVQPVRFYCTDLTYIGPLSREQETWLSFEGYKKSYHVLQDDFFVAVVFTEDHFKAVATNYIVPTTAPALDFVHFNYFTDRGEALHWLEFIKKGQDKALFPALS